MERLSRVSNPDETSRSGERLRSPRQRREGLRKSCQITARLTMSARASERLQSYVGQGTGNFILMADDGGISIRVRLSIDGLHSTEHRLAQGTLVVDWGRSIVSNDESRIRLPRTELRLLAALLEGNGATMSRADLIGRVWPANRMAVVDRENALAVYVCALRKRLAAIGLGDALQTARGVGYRIVLQ